MQGSSLVRPCDYGVGRRNARGCRLRRQRTSTAMGSSPRKQEPRLQARNTHLWRRLDWGQSPHHMAVSRRTKGGTGPQQVRAVRMPFPRSYRDRASLKTPVRQSPDGLTCGSKGNLPYDGELRRSGYRKTLPFTGAHLPPTTTDHFDPDANPCTVLSESVPIRNTTRRYNTQRRVD